MLRPVDKLGRVSIPREWMKKIEKSVEWSDKKHVYMFYDFENNTVTLSEPKDILKCSFCGEREDSKLHFFREGCICTECKEAIGKE